MAAAGSPPTRPQAARTAIHGDGGGHPHAAAGGPELPLPPPPPSSRPSPNYTNTDNGGSRQAVGTPPTMTTMPATPTTTMSTRRRRRHADDDDDDDDCCGDDGHDKSSTTTMRMRTTTRRRRCFSVWFQSRMSGVIASGSSSGGMCPADAAASHAIPLYLDYVRVLNIIRFQSVHWRLWSAQGEPVQTEKVGLGETLQPATTSCCRFSPVLGKRGKIENRFWSDTWGHHLHLEEDIKSCMLDSMHK
ncbi:hypothetical protein EDB89DRAFT_1907727 [Lactarius sanguifluus]|nr:hypothetical protein EDB89DRAFT_1907727 [Lactarius sanguifluus]